MTASPKDADATGRLVAYIPPGPDRDELLGLVRLGLKFAAPRRPGTFQDYIDAVVHRLSAPVTFERLLAELRLDVARRSLGGVPGIPLLAVNNFMECVTYLDDRGHRKSLGFGALRNRLTASRKKKIHATREHEFPLSE